MSCFLATKLAVAHILLAHGDHEHAHDAQADTFAGVQLLPLIVLGVGALAAVVVLALVVRMLLRARGVEAAGEDSLAIDIATLPGGAPPPDAQLEIYNLPMRLVLLVLAPVGRAGEIPPNEKMPQIVDAVAPNLMQILAAHQPEFRRWPPQLSSQGFANMFFKNVPLPGDAGKGTPWCSLAGRIDTPLGPFLAGVVCCCENPNSLGQIAIERPGQWLDVVRVKTGEPRT